MERGEQLRGITMKGIQLHKLRRINMKKPLKRIISMLLVFVLVLTSMNGISNVASAKEKAEKSIVKQNSTVDQNDTEDLDNNIQNKDTKAATNWVNSAGKDAAVNAVESGWNHIVAGSGNSNNKFNDAAFVDQNSESKADGVTEIVFKAGSEAASTRTGLILRYNYNAGNAKGIYVGYDPDGWFYEWANGSESDYSNHVGTALAKGSKATLKVKLEGSRMDIWLNDQVLFENVDVSKVPDAGQTAVKAVYWDASNVTDIYFKYAADIETHALTGTVTETGTSTAVANATVKIIPVSGGAISPLETKTGSDGKYTAQLEDGDYYVTAYYRNMVSEQTEITISGSDNTCDLTLKPITYDGEIISSNKMDVLVAKDFPRVIMYTMKDGADSGKVMYGQTEELKQITINGIETTPTVNAVKSADKMEYTLEVTGGVGTKDSFKCKLDTELVVKDNTLAFNITNVDVLEGIVKTIEIKNHNLVSVNSNQSKANLQGANMSTNTHVSGDREVIVNNSLNVEKEEKVGYMYAFVSNDELSAGLWSNSENNVKADWQRVTATASASDDGEKTIGLSSTYWTYQKGEGYRAEDGIIEYKDGKANKDGATSISVAELPSCKVSIAGDVNNDSDIDWQDGAIAYRDIMNNPNGSETVPNLVAYRIAMNFGSQAQNPFLMSLDNVKKVYLNTDGLGQSILLKGYGSEGHDSGHLNYADIGKRIGGTKDMKTLLEKGAEYGATFGIHVNASETYPESKYFNEDILMKDEDGGYSYGWNWIDQGININADYDLRNGRVDRWRELYDELGGSSNKLDFIYVDVWGNGQSGDNGTWASRQLAKEITGHGWRLAGEWGYANEYDSTFQHWAADLTYGGYSLKGINSDITRFIRNHQKDSWIGNYTSYGGAADAPLLGGYNMKDFEGWQGRSDYAAYINTLFEVNVASKFVQHFTVNDWEEGTPVTMSDNGETYQYTPGMKAELVNDTEGKLVIERKSNDFANDKNGYRTRTMTLNGTKIFEGMEGDTKYLIPWNWDESGKELTSSEQKLYHWNTKGGTTTWTLPSDWSNVQVYKLTELGKEKVNIATVNGGEITLKAEPKTPYVVYNNGHTGSLKEVKWSEGMHLVDNGFNSGSLSAWTINGATEGNGVSIKKSQGSNPMLTFENDSKEITVSQKLTDLKPNTKYAAYVGIDNRSIAEAGIEVSVNGKKTANSTSKSIAKNYIKAYAHNTNKSIATVDDTSYFQNMYVFFETGSDVTNVTLTLSRKAGSGATYFDDVRVCENGNDTNSIGNWDKWESDGVFTQDFENVAQGIYPFVIGNLEGIEDNRTHLAELHEPYTQRNWNDKVISDVIGGTWSLKTNGLTQYENLVYQTVPQNFKFESGQSYMISFDYEAGSDGTYAFVIGHGEYGENDWDAFVPLEATADKNEAGTFTYNVVGDPSGQTWIGIYSTDKAADTKGFSGKKATFMSFNDVMLDNLVITKTDANKIKLMTAMLAAKEKVEEFYTTETWKALQTAYKAADEVYKKVKATQSEVDKATKDLNNALNKLKEIKVTKEVLSKLIEKCEAHKEADYSAAGWLEFIVSVNYAKAAVADKNVSDRILRRAYQDLILDEKALAKDPGPDEQTNGNEIPSSNFEVNAGSAQAGAAGEGDAAYAVDGDEGTLWHTDWGGCDIEDMWFEFTFHSPETVAGFRYLPRSSGDNGKITAYKIMISKDKGASYQEIASGTWEKTVQWNDITFDKVYEDVTNLKLVATETVNEFASAAELRIIGVEKAEQNAPSGFISTDASKNSADGKISGVTTAMEYSTSVNGTYTKCTGTVITGLKAGNYYIRLAGDNLKKPSIPVKVVVFETEKKGSDSNSSSDDTQNTNKTDNKNQTVDVVINGDVKTETVTTVTKEENKTTTKVNVTETNQKTGEKTETSMVKEETKDGQTSVNLVRTDANAKVNMTIQLDKNNKVLSSEVSVTAEKATVKVNKKTANVTVKITEDILSKSVELMNAHTDNSLKAQTVDVKVTVPSKDAVAQLKKSDIISVKVVVTLPKEETACKINKVILPSTVITNAKAEKKQVKVQVKDSANKNIAAWTFTKSALTAYSVKKENVNLLVTSNTVSKADKAASDIVTKDKNNKADKAVFVGFKNGKTLPAPAMVTIPVSGKGKVKAGDKLYLYVVNKKTKKLEEVPNNAYKVSEAGNVSLNVIHGTDYVLLPKKPDSKTVTSLTSQVTVKVNGKTAKAQTIKGTNKKVNAKVTLPITIKKVTTFSKTDESKAITQAKVQYKSSNSKVVTVSKSGVITSKKKGKATITTIVTLKNGKKKEVKTTITVK